jgi:hypothetical protein
MIILGCSSGSTYVIPAKAGIQLMEKFLRSGADSSFCLLRRVVFWLDSRFASSRLAACLLNPLRGNDEAKGLFRVESSRSLISDYPLAPSFPRRRESSIKKRPRSGQNRCYVPLRGDYSIIWIPAFAGMTRFFANFGLMTDGRRIA